MSGTFITHLLSTLFTVLSIFGTSPHSALSSLAAAVEPSVSTATTSKYPPPQLLGEPASSTPVFVPTPEPHSAGVVRTPASSVRYLTTVIAAPASTDVANRLDSLIGIVGNVTSLLPGLEDTGRAVIPEQVAAGGNGGIAAASNIGTLSNVVISNPVITGGSVPASSIVGTVGNAIDTALGEIDDLTSATITAENASTSNLAAANAAITNLSLGSGPGFLTVDSQGNVIATSSVGAGAFVGVLTPGSGGTGITTAPAYGQLLLGNGSGGYALTATSSLGFPTLASFSASYPLLYDGNGSFSLGFGTSSNNVWSGTNAFTGNVVMGSATATNLFATNVSMNALTLTGNKIYSGTSSAANSWMFMPGSALFGTASAAPNGIISPFNLYISGDTVDTTTNGNGNLIGFSVEHAVGNGHTGGREAFQSQLAIVGTPSISPGGAGYVGGQFMLRGSANLTGTGGAYSNYKGGAFASNANIYLTPGATFYNLANAEEFDISVPSGASTADKYGISIIHGSNDAVRGAYDDSAISINDQDGASDGWHYGLSFGSYAHQWAFATDSTLIMAQQRQLGPTSPDVALNGIDFRNVAFGGYAFASNGFSVDGSGNATVANLTATGTLATIGNVGIGTTSQSVPLFVNGGNGQGTPALAAGTVATFQSNVCANCAANISIISGSTGTGAINFGTYSNQLKAQFVWENSNSSFYLSGGSLGIGTTSPAAMLSISGNQYTTGGLGVGLLNPTAGTLQTSGNATIGGTLVLNGNSGTSTIATGQGFTVGGSQFLVQQGSGYVGINNSSPSYSLDVNGFINTSQNAGYKQAGNTILYASSTIAGVFLGQGAGAGVVANATSSSLTSGTFSTAIGYQALGNATSSAQYSTAVGYGALQSSPTISGSGQNTAVGYEALQNNSSGFANTGLGFQAMLGNTTGNNNTALGNGILWKNTTGNWNSIVGTGALWANQTGGTNSGTGAQAYYFNTSATSSSFVGYRAGFGNPGNYSNQGGTVLGFESGYNFQTGSDYNTLLGFQSGYDITTGNNNLVLGTEQATGGSITTGSNNILIGKGVRYGLNQTGSNQLNIGNLIFATALGSENTISTGYVGIGTSTPNSLFSIGNANGINFSTASSTFYSTGGINLMNGCFAMQGNCLSLNSLPGTVALGQQTSGILPVANGGTGTNNFLPPNYINILNYGVSASSPDNTTALQNAINAAVSNGLTLYIPSASSTCYKYTAPLTISGNITIVGDYVTGNWASGINVPLGSPPVAGSVLCPTSNGNDAIDISGNSLQVNISNIGILFQTVFSNTGDGIHYTPAGSTQGLSGPVWQNVMVYGHDGNHYAYNIKNPIYGTFTGVDSFGGGGWNISAGSGGGNYGNATFVEPYVQVVVGGSANGFNLTASSTQNLNLLTFIRPQAIIDNVAGVSPSGNLPSGSQAIWYQNQNVQNVRTIAPDFEANVSSSSFTVGSAGFGNDLDWAGLFTDAATINAPAWGSNGIMYGPQTRTFNDTTSAGTGLNTSIFAFPGTHVSANSSVTYPVLSTIYVTPPILGTNAAATRLDAIYATGEIYTTSDLGSNSGLYVNGGTQINHNSSGTTQIGDGTATGAVTIGGASNKVGIGTSTPYSKLEIWGPDTGSTTAFAVVNNASTTVFASYDNGNATYSGSLFQSSDQRLKTNISSLDASSSLSLVDQLNPVSYTRIDQPDQGSTLGFIAQEVQKLFPNLVTMTAATALTPGGTLTLNYTGLIAPLVSAVQALQNEIASIQGAIAGLAESFTTQRLCLTNTNGVQTCITQAQLATLLATSNASNAANTSSAGSVSSGASSTPPIIQINGSNPAIIQVGTAYSDLGAKITGPQADLNLGIATWLNGTLVNPLVIDTSAAATDTIDYVVTDQNGLTSTSTRTLIIEAAEQALDAASTSNATTTSANDVF